MPVERFYRLCLTWALVCLVSVFGTLWVHAEEMDSFPDNQLHAQSAVLVDGETGRILYEKNANKKMAMASTTKIMTCLVALENSKPDDIVTISQYAASMPDVQLNAIEGDVFYIEDLLYALMLESHNDVAVAIAEHVGGSEEEFANLMNERAKEIGCTNTHFVTANGLDAEEHYTTASDLAKITVEALKNDAFCNIIQTEYYKFSNVNESRTYELNNKNAFLNQMEGAYGVKTGFTNDAGYCFVGASKKNKVNLISVVLGSGWPPNKTWKWEDTWTLMNYGFDHFTYRKIGQAQMDVGHLTISNGRKSEVRLRADTSIEDILLGASEKITIKMIKELKREAPITEDEIVGWIYYQVNNVTVKKYPIYPVESVLREKYMDVLKKIGSLWILF